MTVLVEVSGPAGFVLPVGGFVVVAGASGTGKTSLLHTLAGVVRPRGPVEVRWPAVPARLWRELALVPQSVTLLEELTVADNVALPALVATGRPPARLGEVLDALGVAHLRDRLGGQISVGERQRTMVARAVATPSTLLLADEPTAHQDDGFARRVRDLLVAEAAIGRAVVVATREPAPWLTAGDAVLVELPRRRATAG